ncbi:MAG: Mrp/NBP35 family ATP-binding protein [Sphingobacteriales bacterium]|nr:Mrp/NBP35 family ATP-binding protein [Sphingobacteriales bacterium]
MQSITYELIIQALSRVEDPDLHRDLVSLGMVRDVAFESRRIAFTLVLTTPACPLKDFLRNRCIESLQQTFGEDITVEIEMTAQVSTLRQEQESVLPYVKNVIAVASGKGGVGKSTLAANLALALAKKGARVGLLDADLYGPSVPTMFGLQQARPQVIEEDGKHKMVPIERYGLKLLSIGFLMDDKQAVVWRGPMASSALKQLVNDAVWGELDYLLFDLPPGTGDIHLTLVQQVPLTGAVIITTPQEVALADVRKSIAMFQLPQIAVPILGVVENMAYFTPPELPDHKYYIFGRGGGEQLAEEFQVPFLGQMPLVQSVREGGDIGNPALLSSDALTVSLFDDLAGRVARQVAVRNEQFNPRLVNFY